MSDYKYLIGAIHSDGNFLKLYKTVDVLEEVFDADEGPLVVAYRRRLKPKRQLELKSEDDEYSRHRDDD